MNKRKQQGMAMVVAMLILSIVTVFAASIAFDYQFSIRRVSNQILMQQAYQYALATEAIASKALQQDLQNDADDQRTVDHKGEIWAEEDLVFAVEGGAYSGKLVDLQGKFNINSLRPPSFSADQYPPQVPYTISQGIFIRLLQALGDDEFSVNEDEAKEITQAILDWLDTDSVPQGFACGEDSAYQNIEDRQAHRVANGPFYSVSELRLICNMPLPLYYRLQSQLTVWPTSGNSTINMNTASTVLLRSVLMSEQDAQKLQIIKEKTHYQVPPPLAAEDVQKILERTQADVLLDEALQNQREQKNLDENSALADALNEAAEEIGYSTFADLQTDLGNLKLWPNAPLGLYSNWFLLQAQVLLERLNLTLESVISRENGSISIVERSTSGL